ncbi:MAG: hypothetical protein HC848_10885 [Limnobacter sp.]|nr:hypothetical protein [Limnobacter sp.]
MEVIGEPHRTLIEEAQSTNLVFLLDEADLQDSQLIEKLKEALTIQAHRYPKVARLRITPPMPLLVVIASNYGMKSDASFALSTRVREIPFKNWGKSAYQQRITEHVNALHATFCNIHSPVSPEKQQAFHRILSACGNILLKRLETNDCFGNEALIFLRDVHHMLKHQAAGLGMTLQRKFANNTQTSVKNNTYRVHTGQTATAFDELLANRKRQKSAASPT